MRERFVDRVPARGVNALIGGIVIHVTLSTATFARDQIRAIVVCFLEVAP